jgi:hypothetical protein
MGARPGGFGNKVPFPHNRSQSVDSQGPRAGTQSSVWGCSRWAQIVKTLG